MSKIALFVSWEDVPHLTKEQKASILASIPPWQRDSRTRGVPQLGAGAIYQVAESEVVVQPFPIPDFWPRCFALDVGWNRTAAIWLAKNPDTNQVFAYNEYYRGQAEPSVHAAAIKARGHWIPGVIDPAARGRSQIDGKKLFDMYMDLGLELTKADNSREAGIYQVWELLSQGQLKIFSTCVNTLSEYRLYRRDEKGNIVKKNDHLMDALRYGVMSGLALAVPMPFNAAGGKWFHWSPPKVWAG
jgi:hypothetical protein